MLTQDRDEELVLFLELRRLEKGHQDSLLTGSGHCKSSTTTMSSQRYPLRRTAADNFLYSESEKSDYDWLVTPPGSPSKSLMNQPDANPMPIESQLEKCREEERDNKSSRNQTIGLKRPSSSKSSRSTSRPSTPATRSTPTPTSRVTSTASRATLTSSSTSSSSSRPTSRPSTPTRRPSSSGTSRTATSTAARATLTSFSTSSSARPTSRPSSSGSSRAKLTTARATTVNAKRTTGTATSTRSNTRPLSAPNTKQGSRPSTPTRRPPTPTGSSSVLKSKPTKPASSPTLRSRPWEPYEMPGFSLEAPSNLRTTLRDRPQTASSSRTKAFGASSSRSSSIESATARRQSCSPSRNRPPIGNANAPGPLLRGRRAKKNSDDGGLISPVAKGNQMVERVVNMRKLPPPRLTENGGRGGGKSSSGSDGFGRNLSKSSFDMALRHMDIKRGSMTGNFRPLVTKVPAASLYSVRSSGTRRKRPVSSSGSSESSVNILCLDGSDDNLSDISC